MTATEAESTPIEATLHAWFSARVPAEWFPGGLDVTSDADEILVLGTLPEDADADEASRISRIAEHREATREARIAIASEAERTFNRHVAWGARAGSTERVFTSLSV